MTSITDAHSLFASSSIRSHQHLPAAPPLRAWRCDQTYLVSQGAQLAGVPVMGLGTFYPPRVRREQAEMHDTQLQTRYRFGHSYPVSRKTRVSCFIVTAVLSNVHMCFPYPLPRHLPIVLLDVSPTIAGVLCAIKREMFVHSSAPPDASGRTNGRGHFVPEVVSVYRNKAP